MVAWQPEPAVHAFECLAAFCTLVRLVDILLPANCHWKLSYECMRLCILQVGRPRPNFAERCWPGGQTHAYNEAGVPVCSTNSVDPAEGRKSFPSGFPFTSSCLAIKVLCDSGHSQLLSYWATCSSYVPQLVKFFFLFFFSCRQVLSPVQCAWSVIAVWVVMCKQLLDAQGIASDTETCMGELTYAPQVYQGCLKFPVVFNRLLTVPHRSHILDH